MSTIHAVSNQRTEKPIVPSAGRDQLSVSQQIRKQIESLQKQMDKIRQGQDSNETKGSAIKQIQEQIKQLQVQLQEAAMQEKQEELEERQTKMAEHAEAQTIRNQDGDELIFSNEVQHMISSSHQLSQMTTLRKVQVEMENRHNYAKADQIAAQIIGKSMKIHKDQHEMMERSERLRVGESKSDKLETSITEEQKRKPEEQTDSEK
ncbi:hypothetical protein [Fontibacillus sp. BL9]|uniref:hypothetical protein n=1 Tax=Fontibacillus sp. BL9 TaxID=3389971 RepID=UPI00397E0131